MENTNDKFFKVGLLILLITILMTMTSCKTVLPVYDSEGDLTSFEVKRRWLPRSSGSSGYRQPYTNPYRSYNRTKVWNKVMYSNTWK